MSAAVRDGQLLLLIRGQGVLGEDGTALARPAHLVTYTRDHAPSDWLVDGDVEQPVETHRAAHAEGRPSEATIAYGAGIQGERVLRRLLDLAALARDTGLLRAVCPVPGEGDTRRPGSWGVEDLGVILAARAALPDEVWVRPDWHRLGAAACQVAVAFGATDWVIPSDDRADPGHLAAAVGARAVPR